jgi:hypothetical protein
MEGQSYHAEVFGVYCVFTFQWNYRLITYIITGVAQGWLRQRLTGSAG